MQAEAENTALRMLCIALYNWQLHSDIFSARKSLHESVGALF